MYCEVDQFLGSWFCDHGQFISHLISSQTESRARPLLPLCIPSSLSQAQVVTEPCCGCGWPCLELHSSETIHTGEQFLVSQHSISPFQGAYSLTANESTGECRVLVTLFD